MDAGLLDAATSLSPAGLVIEATGAGNTSEDLRERAERAMGAGVAVVLCSRCAAGSAGAYYAFPGGGATWVKAGAMLAGTLSGPKARIALSLALGAGLRGPELAAFLSGPEKPVQQR